MLVRFDAADGGGWQEVPGREGWQWLALWREEGNAFFVRGEGVLLAIDPPPLDEALEGLLEVSREDGSAAALYCSDSEPCAFGTVLARRCAGRGVTLLRDDDPDGSIRHVEPGDGRHYVLRTRRPSAPALTSQTLEIDAAVVGEILHAPGYSPDAMLFRIGGLLFCGALPNRPFPALGDASCWDGGRLLESIGAVAGLFESEVTVMLPRYGPLLDRRQSMLVFQAVREHVGGLGGQSRQTLHEFTLERGFGLLEEAARLLQECTLAVWAEPLAALIDNLHATAAQLLLSGRPESAAVRGVLAFLHSLGEDPHGRIGRARRLLVEHLLLLNGVGVVEAGAVDLTALCGRLAALLPEVEVELPQGMVRGCATPQRLEDLLLSLLESLSAQAEVSLRIVGDDSQPVLSVLALPMSSAAQFGEDRLALFNQQLSLDGGSLEWLEEGAATQVQIVLQGLSGG